MSRQDQYYYWHQQHDGLFACNACGAEYKHQCICLCSFEHRGVQYEGAQVLSLGLASYDDRLLRTMLVGDVLDVDGNKLVRVG
jgi:hypothetical protein